MLLNNKIIVNYYAEILNNVYVFNNSTINYHLFINFAYFTTINNHCLLFDVFNFSLFIFNHLLILSSSQLIFLILFESALLAIWFMYIRNSNGPKIDRYGTLKKKMYVVCFNLKATKYRPSIRY